MRLAIILLAIGFKITAQTLHIGPFTTSIDKNAKNNYTGQLISSCVSYNFYYITDRPIIGGAMGLVATAGYNCGRYLIRKDKGLRTDGSDVIMICLGALTQTIIYAVVVNRTDHKHKWNHLTKEELDERYANIVN